MNAMKIVARQVGLLSVCLFAFGTGFFIATEQKPRHEPVEYPAWVDTVCLHGKEGWGRVAETECHVIELPMEHSAIGKENKL